MAMPVARAVVMVGASHMSPSLIDHLTQPLRLTVASRMVVAWYHEDAPSAATVSGSSADGCMHGYASDPGHGGGVV